VLPPTSFLYSSMRSWGPSGRVKRSNTMHPRTELARLTAHEKTRERGFLFPGGIELPNPPAVDRRKPAGDFFTKADGTLGLRPTQDLPLVTCVQAIQLLTKKAEDQCSEVGRFFRMYDKDKSGCIDTMEMRAMLLNFNIQMDDANFDKLMRKIDPDGSGEIQYDEFLDFFGAAISGGTADDENITTLQDTSAKKIELNKKEKPMEQMGFVSKEQCLKILGQKVAAMFAQVRQAFRSFDLDKSGSISKFEFRRLLSRFCLYLSDSNFDEVYREFDPDNGGEIEYDEFIGYFGEILAPKETGGISRALQGSITAEQADINNALWDAPPPTPPRVHKTRPSSAPSNRPPSTQMRLGQVTVSAHEAKMMLRYIAQKELSKLKQVWRAYDKNNTTVISTKALKDLTLGLGLKINNTEFGQLMSALQIKVATISLSQFLAAFKSKSFDPAVVQQVQQRMAAGARPVTAKGPTMKRMITKEDQILRSVLEKRILAEKGVIEAFRAWDRDKSRAMGKPEMMAMLAKFGIKLDDKTLSKMFKQFDSNNDGDVDIKEFVRYFERSEFEAINESKRASPVDIKRMPKPAALKQQKFKSNQRVIASKAIDALKTKIRRRMVVDSSMVIRACGAVDRNNSGLVKLAEMGVICDTYLFPVSRDHLATVLQPFTQASGIDYKSFIVHYAKAKTPEWRRNADSRLAY